jgi:formylglycine-generating enzyme required for sulfatase activity
MVTITPEESSLVDYSFEISSTEITVEQFQQFRPERKPAFQVTGSRDCPMNWVNLFDAMQYCRWLSEQEPGFAHERCVYPPSRRLVPG